MARTSDVDELIRKAVEAEDVEEFDRLAEPGLPEMVVDPFRGRLRAYVVMFFFMMLACTAVAVYCGFRFLSTSDVPAMLRWGAGFFLCTFAALNAKNWYWMQMEHLAPASSAAWMSWTESDWRRSSGSRSGDRIPRIQDPSATRITSPRRGRHAL